MKKWIAYIFFFMAMLSLNAHANTRQTVIESTKVQPVSSVRPVLFNDSLIYQTKTKTQSELWSYNTNTLEKSLLFDGDLLGSSGSYFNQQHLFLMNDSIVFSSTDGEKVNFYKSNGTAEGTILMNSSPLAYVGAYLKDGLLFTWSADGYLVTTDGVSVEQHAIKNAEINKVCGFSNNDVIALENGFGPTAVIRSTNGERTNLIDSLPFGFLFFNLKMYGFNKHCLITSSSTTEKGALIVKESGETLKLELFHDLNNFYDYFVFKDRLYAFQETDNLDGSKIIRFNHSFDGFDKTYEISDDQRFFRIANSQQFIIAQSVTAVNHPVSRYTHYLNDELELNEQLSGLDKPFPNAAPVLDGEIYTAFINQDSDPVQALSPFPDFPNSSTTLVQDKNITSLITNPTSDEVYLFLQDLVDRSFSIAKLTKTPGIDYSTAGLWYNPDIQNQGIVINRGQRADGTNYLFVSVSAQDEGLPLWLAGVSNINLPQPTIEIELTRHEGANFFEQGSAPSRIVWGSLELEMTGCHSLQATFKPAGSDLHVVNLIRIDNNSFNYFCSN